MPPPSTSATTAPPAPGASAAPATAEAATPGAAAYAASIAHSADQIRAAQRLRYRVFSDELGARLHTPLAGHDVDDVDDVADHLIVTERATGSVVGTYRLVPPGRGDRLYSDGEFDLGALTPLRPSLVEAGRSCVDPDHRNGTVINLLWSALTRYVLLSGHRYLAGCASVPLADGERPAHTALCLAEGRHAAPAGLRVTPHRPWRPTAPFTGRPSPADLPPLLRGYLRIGAWLCGPPAHDPEFGTADFFTLLDMERLGDRYRRYFLGTSSEEAGR
ncbi:GNAT family N-acetyltransferase [Streptomyces chumphonensis]|uniref:GNAT family N-acetyltransferase n=1 Tax=Streptomyces chumphonensis TaxID=1214925 RepID=A0A927IDN2_9ACTN|nr:GNAT family N-acyltransferase [Streptomyces chumphonensis]MBD3933302.1 GNAT family N-acetyltransferase [Streptomyces chumphonensis]